MAGSCGWCRSRRREREDAGREKKFRQRRVRAAVWTEWKRKDVEEENHDSLIPELSDSLLFIVL